MPTDTPLASRIAAFNERLAVYATAKIGTMWCVYLFATLTVVPIFVPALDQPIQYISSAFLQLVFLPLIMVGTSVTGKQGEERAAQDHQVLLAQFEELKQMHADLHALLNTPVDTHHE